MVFKVVVYLWRGGFSIKWNYYKNDILLLIFLINNIILVFLRSMSDHFLKFMLISGKILIFFLMMASIVVLLANKERGLCTHPVSNKPTRRSRPVKGGCKKSCQVARTPCDPSALARRVCKDKTWLPSPLALPSSLQFLSTHTHTHTAICIQIHRYRDSH